MRSEEIYALQAGERLALPPQLIHVSEPDTDVTPYDQQTSSSRTTHAMGVALEDRDRRRSNPGNAAEQHAAEERRSNVQRGHVGSHKCVDSYRAHDHGRPHHLHDGPVLEQELADQNVIGPDAAFLQQEPEAHQRERLVGPAHGGVFAERFAADCTVIRHGSPELVELAEQAGLTVSSRLLQVARRVIEPNQ